MNHLDGIGNDLTFIKTFMYGTTLTFGICVVYVLCCKVWGLWLFVCLIHLEVGNKNNTWFLKNLYSNELFPMQPMEIYVDDEAKLTLHGLVQVLLEFKFYACLLLSFVPT